MDRHELRPAVSGTFALCQAALVLLLAGCPHYGIIDDGSSISYGPSNQGALVSPARLPVQGEGYVMPHRWATRGLHYGTDELVATLAHAARRVSAETAGALVHIADLSLPSGGPSAWHRSHQTGRDADILFFAMDEAGRPVVLESMVQFRDDGTAILRDASGDKVIYFDVERNWLLVRALIENPISEVQFLFVYDPLKQRLLDHAREAGEPEELVAQASYILHQPGDALPHDDHFHVRIYCAQTDRTVGCRERGALRWTKKDIKYGRERVARTEASSALRAVVMAPMPAMMALGAFPFLP